MISMTFPPLEPPRILLHVIIPGQPHAQERARTSGFIRTKTGKFIPRFYDPNSDEKETFRWQLKAACPTLKPDLHARLGIRLTVWTGLRTAPDEDCDNFLKHYMDSMSPPKQPKRKKGRPAVDLSKSFAVWGNDNQVDEAYVRIRRGAANPKVEILVYELNDEGA